MDPYVYQYSIGTIVFTVGVYFAARHGYVGLSGRGLYRLLGLMVVLLGVGGAQAYLEYGAMTERPAVAYAGPPHVRSGVGTPLDYGIMVVYFAAILFVGTWFGRRQRTVKDFFFGGQRFSWWLIAVSMVATVVGSYSFVKYSQVAFTYGVASAQTYLNDWFWMPLLAFGWIPILYFSRVTSVPEYFERRFDRHVRLWVSVIMIIYLVGYVGVNLFTMGKALSIMLGWPILGSAILVAVISAIYVTSGGQTSVIMTDLLQGVMLLVTGFLIFGLGFAELGGFSGFWEHIPRDLRRAFTNFNQDPAYNSVGIFWQDGVANTVMFYFLNQGIIMRFLAAKSAEDGRKAAFVTALVLMPVAAAVVASGGWVGRAMVHAGLLSSEVRAEEVFFVATEVLARPGVFGMIMACLTAALMSTVDTLITAVAAVVVNDFYRPYFRPKAEEGELLRVARITSVTVTLLGILLVPVFANFKSIYAAHGAFTAAVTPPLVVAFLLSVFWRRYTKAGAVATLAGGMAVMLASIVYPEMVKPFAHGVPMIEAEGGLFGGMQTFQYMRAFFGLVTSAAIGISVSLLSRARPLAEIRGLVWGTLSDAITYYKGSPGREDDVRRAEAKVELLTTDRGHSGAAQLAGLAVSRELAAALGAKVGDLVFVSDRRSWLGGLNAAHAIIEEISEHEGKVVQLGPELSTQVVAPGRVQKPVIVERLY